MDENTIRIIISVYYPKMIVREFMMNDVHQDRG